MLYVYLNIVRQFVNNVQFKCKVVASSASLKLFEGKIRVADVALTPLPNCAFTSRATAAR